MKCWYLYGLVSELSPSGNTLGSQGQEQMGNRALGAGWTLPSSCHQSQWSWGTWQYECPMSAANVNGGISGGIRKSEKLSQRKNSCLGWFLVIKRPQAWSQDFSQWRKKDATLGSPRKVHNKDDQDLNTPEKKLSFRSAWRETSEGPRISRWIYRIGVETKVTQEVYSAEFLPCISQQPWSIPAFTNRWGLETLIYFSEELDRDEPDDEGHWRPTSLWECRKS